MKSFSVLLSVAVCCVVVALTQEDLQTSSSDFYQTQWEEYYNQLAESESVQSPTTSNKNPDFLNILNKYAIKNKQDFLGIEGMDMNMVGMGASMISAVVAVGALAYALTLEARILTNDARSLSTCETLSTITKATLTSLPTLASTTCNNGATMTGGDGGAAGTNLEIVTCINTAITALNANVITAFNAYGNPTC